ncbi:MAG TPA: glycosyltransferase [Terriglobia bacterium]|nr:glycosyltransferase [Terriglobia bacterium]
MTPWKPLISDALTVFNFLLASYFVVGNGVYTLLMLMSLVSVWLHNRRLAYEGLEEMKASTVTPPVTLIMPAHDEQNVIVESVRSALRTDYPGLQVFVVDDGSNDQTLERLIAAFNLVTVDLIYRPRTPTRGVRAFYQNPASPNLLVISKANGGKPDALNAGLNVCRTPYFCSLDADCLLEPDALLRLMRPILRSPSNTVASGGVVRILNGCEVKDDRVVQVRLPRSSLERFQVVEYLRSFLFGRTGWDLLGGTLIVSGAFALFHRETVLEAGGFSTDTVTEDMELVVRLHRWAAGHGRKIAMSFTSDPVCWSQCPSTLKMLARQRRRWQLGLCQTLWKNRFMLLNERYGAIGLLSFPFHVYVEGLGAVVELLGYCVIVLAILFRVALPNLLIPFVVVGLAWATFLSVGAVVLEELTHRRYPRLRDLETLLWYALLENFGYRQLILWYRFQGVARFLAGIRKWEKVIHHGAAEQAMEN